MDTLKKIVLLALIGTIFVTCKKQELPPGGTVGQPVFTFNGTIGANVLNLQAGINNYYMYSTFTQDSGAYNFTGTLKSISTANNSIQIIINDYRTSTLNASVALHIDSALSTNAPYYYKVPGGTPLNYAITFRPVIYSGTPEVLSYNYGDGKTTSTTNITPVTHIYSKLKVDTTSLAIKFSNGKTLTITNPVNLIRQSHPLTIDSIQFKINSDSVSLKTDSLIAYISGGRSPFTYAWDFGDGFKTSTSATANRIIRISHTYTISARSGAIDTAKILVLDSNQSIAVHKAIVADTTSDSSVCRMGCFISAPAPVPNPAALSDITINYTDPSGNVYTSNNALQPLTSTFQVLSVSNYQNNISNNPTKMLKVVFNCRLYNGNNFIAASGIAIIAVAYQ